MTAAPSTTAPPSRRGDLHARSSAVIERLASRERPFAVSGTITRAVGTLLQARLGDVAIGELCELTDARSGSRLEAEVLGFSSGEALLAPIGNLAGLSTFTQVRALGRGMEIAVGDAILGRVVDGLCRPADGRGPLAPTGGARRPLECEPPPPMTRQLIARPMATGIRSVDGCLTCGEGQRIGIYGEPGGGKSTLIAQIVQGADADVVVIGLIGERGREAREFIEHTLDEGSRARTAIVLATSDRPALERVKAAQAATAVAEHFRDAGRRVLLIMDSVTRYARALREIGLAAGEPPTRRGYPASTFAVLPQLLERAGPGAEGTITAFYTVLVEGDGTNDPIAEETRGILDGHLVLSAKLAAANHYPAVDVLKSRSRVMDAVVDRSHVASAGRIRTLLARYGETEFLLRMGEYRPGADAETDEAVSKHPHIAAFLQQARDERTSLAETVAALHALSGTAS